MSLMQNVLDLKDFTIKQLIGKGSFAEVYLCNSFARKNAFVVKVVEFGIDIKVKSQSENEIKILKELSNHCNIVQFHSVLRETHRTTIALEYVSKIHFLQGIVDWSYLNVNDIKFAIKQLLSAVQFCHSKRIVHRDIRPDNILWSGVPTLWKPHTSPTLKLIDFNISRKIPTNANFIIAKTQGDPQHMPPESLTEPSIITFSGDVWGVGVLLFTVFAGYPPFMDYNYKHLLLNVIEGNYALPDYLWNHVSSSGKDIMMKMLQVDYKKRWSANKLLNHSWFSTFSNIYSVWPAQNRLKCFLENLEVQKSRTNHRKFMLTIDERKPFIPDDAMFS